jgi:DNA-binding GntR family transcriptional regulator
LTKPATRRPRLAAGRSRAAAALPAAPASGAARLNQFEQAYEAIEDRLVNCELAPGRFLALQELQDLVGFGRTPVHQAVNRFAADTLIVVHPRRGLQVTPIDLTRERALLELRRDMERFVVRLATQNSSAAHRNQMLHIKRYLLDNRDRMKLEGFNVIDRRIDQLMLAAAAEPFVENTLRPLHTIFRRIGWLYHAKTKAPNNLRRTIDVHLAVVDAVSHGRADVAIAASDELITFMDSMFDALERQLNPALLDSSAGEFDVA